MFCSNCGKPLQPNAQFCGSCGQAVNSSPDATAVSADATVVRQPDQPTPPPAHAAPPGAHAAPPAQVAPPAYVPPAAPMQPAVPVAPNAALVGLSRGLSRILIWDWVGPLKVATATLGTSLILAIAFGLATKPSDEHLHWGFKTVYTWLVWWWESMFGVSLVAGANASGTETDTGISGSGSAHAGLAAMPLTLTVITLVVAAFFYRRAIRNSPNALSALLLGVRSALFIAVPLWFFSLFASLSINDLTNLAGESGATPLDEAKRHGINASFSLTVSSTQAFFISLLLVIGLFAALTLSRADWFTGRALSAVRLCLVAPMRALGAMGIALVLGGLLFTFITFTIRWVTHTGLPGGGDPSLSTHNWFVLIFGLIAYSANAGVMALGLGSWSGFGTSVSASWSGSIPNVDSFAQGSLNCDVHRSITWWSHASNTISGMPCTGTGRGQAQAEIYNWPLTGKLPGDLSQFAQYYHPHSPQLTTLDWGLWTAAILAPIVLIYVAWRILKSNGTDAKSMLISLGTWVVSLLVVIPVLSYFAEIGVSGNGSASGSSGFNPSASGSASIGLSGSAVFLVFAYGLLIALIVGLLSGAINKNSFSGLAAIAEQARAQQAAQQAAQAQQSGQVPPAYQPPPPAYQPPTQTPPAYQPPPDRQPPPYQG